MDVHQILIHLKLKEYGESQGMRILWSTDQQAWTKREYDVWQMCARFLNNKQAKLRCPFDFHLNTGDISQKNANRDALNGRIITIMLKI